MHLGVIMPSLVMKMDLIHLNLTYVLMPFIIVRCEMRLRKMETTLLPSFSGSLKVELYF